MQECCWGKGQMIEVHPQYVVDDQKRRKAVLLPLAEWEQLLGELEELDDIRAYDQAKKHPSEVIPLEGVARELRRRTKR